MTEKGAYTAMLRNSQCKLKSLARNSEEHLPMSMLFTSGMNDEVSLALQSFTLTLNVWSI